MRSLLARALALLVISAGPALADVVEFKDGRLVEGKFKGASPAVVAIEVGGRTMVIPFEDVRAIYFGAPPPAVTAPPPTVAPAPTPPPAPPPTAAPVPTPSPAPAPAPPPLAAPAPTGAAAPTIPPAASGPPGSPATATTATPSPPGSPSPDAVAALDALRTLQGAVAAGVSYRDYAPLVIETRGKVETFLQNPASNDSALKGAMNAAMNLYVLGAEAWTARTRNSGYEALAANPAADLCPALGKKMLEAREQGVLKPNALGTGIGIAAGLPQIWACAAEKVEEASRLTP